MKENIFDPDLNVWGGPSKNLCHKTKTLSKITITKPDKNNKKTKIKLLYIVLFIFPLNPRIFATQ